MKYPRSFLAAAALLAVSGASSAVTISGFTLPDGSSVITGTVYENIVTGVGQTLSGYGTVGQINGLPLSTYYSGELTFTFGGYTVTSFSSPTNVTFSGGWINFYADASADFNKDVAASAGDGTLFLTLAGRGLTSTNVNNGGGLLQGSGNGLADVDFTGTANGNTAGAGAVANGFFNNNAYGGADVLFNTSYTIYSSGSSLTPGGGPGVVGSADLHVTPIPEPETYALMLAGLGVMGWMSSRRRSR
ncbi:FxDxF family PEP-CTERM protein [Aquabacterium sp. J223]|uniref:FxDxF family PEP-CTERM protein n=1 Tax=Aquabacterium sp. J223 TaxID=2898431 RepID=UPI0021ADF4E3|nr:FxDxF family PEP-CTERM protein [Aquabacterium sp. J223]UUX94038.1 FxDxF family PEP-CTERM protein [Aquabacterium sp. J223]